MPSLPRRGSLAPAYALLVMKKQRRGVFLITASTAAIRPRLGVQVHAASKGAVVTLTKSLALEEPPRRPVLTSGLRPGRVVIR
jgi:NAD(P)-dependent dehydrogenase (short-subunit alcohol dehydrogenase family)